MIGSPHELLAIEHLTREVYKGTFWEEALVILGDAGKDPPWALPEDFADLGGQGPDCFRKSHWHREEAGLGQGIQIRRSKAVENL